MSDHRERTLTGGCQCGAVRYALYTQPRSEICHCRMCQKAVGGPFAALASVARQDLEWTRGTPALYDSSSVATRGFCATCGTPLTYQSLDRKTINVTTGSLDKPEAAPPTIQYGIEARLTWFDTLATLLGSTTEDKYTGLVSHQHPDHDT